MPAWSLAWRVDPSILDGLLLAAVLYALAATRWRRSLGGSGPPAPGQVLAVSLALLTVWLALESPLDALADQASFAAHMLQHLLLVLVVPPLLHAGTPGWMLRPLLCRPRLRPLVRAVTQPLVAFLIFNTIFSLAHMPAVFDQVQGNEAVHALEHLVFLGSGLLLWWPVLSPLQDYPRLAGPLQLGYLFLQTLPCALVGALITLAGAPLYAGYALATPAFGLSAEQDQQIGGLLMWIGGSLYYFLAMAIAFFAWAEAEEGAWQTAS